MFSYLTVSSLIPSRILFLHIANKIAYGYFPFWAAYKFGFDIPFIPLIRYGFLPSSKSKPLFGRPNPKSEFVKSFLTFTFSKNFDLPFKG